jgi:hypothetical protein
VVDATPFKRDIILELAEACKRNDMKLGLYYSQCIDWHEEHGGAYDENYYHSNFGMSWDNDWDFPNRKEKNYFAEMVVHHLGGSCFDTRSSQSALFDRCGMGIFSVFCHTDSYLVECVRYSASS